MSAPDIKVRSATAADAATLAELVGRLIRQYGLTVPPSLERALARDGFGKKPFFDALLAEDAAGEARGVALFYPVYHPSRAAPGLFLEDLVVAEDARGLGIGRLLLRHLARYAHENGYVGIEWTVDAANTDAQAFYARMGANRLTGKTHWEIGASALPGFATDSADE